jgi:hypothetical protein
MKNKLTHHDAKRILQWCMDTYGKSKYNGNFPAIEFKKPDHSQQDYAGYYDEDEELIFINKDLNTTIEELTKTIIHEYTHYVKHPMKDYYTLARYLKHDKNPMEIEASKIEKRDYKKCLNEIKNRCKGQKN